LLDAIAALSRRLGALAVAPLFRSAAVSPIAQPDFLNTVVVARSDLAPDELLRFAKQLERAAGRKEGPHWGPRPLDVDVLLIGDVQLRSDDLELPHPRLRERSFVLAPLADLLPDARLPPDGRSVHELLAELATDPTLRRIPWTADP
jgi:2-amino-4-hydroxy-6-hydroxymethyldihydropteridine diphosphokinase